MIRALVLCGPSGVGKGTLSGLLLAALPERLAFCVSHTTRAPRPGEVDGQHYHFVDDDAMLALVRNGLMAEHTQVHGRRYGTSLAELAKVSRRGRVALLDLEQEGVASVKKVEGVDARVVAVLPPSMEELERRLRQRGSESEEQVRLRLQRAARDVHFGETSPLVDARLINYDSWEYGLPWLKRYVTEEAWPPQSSL